MDGWTEGLKEEETIYVCFCFSGGKKIKSGEVFDEDLELLSKKIANWQSLARGLLFSNREITVFDKENDEFSEKAFAMLIHWKRRLGSAATYKVLYDALCHPLVSRRDLAYEFYTDASSSLVST